MTDFNVSLRGLPEIQAKLGYDTLLEPEMEEAVETIFARPLRVRKKNQGLGLKNNTVAVSRSPVAETSSPLAGQASSTLIWPRRTGAAWLRYNIAAVRKMAPNVFRAAIRKIEARWAS